MNEGRLFHFCKKEQMKVERLFLFIDSNNNKSI